jgi:hypothetical protein
MAKSGKNENNERVIEKLVRVGFYELEKTIGKVSRDIHSASINLSW